MKKYGLPAIITILFGAIYYYFALPPIHIKASEFWLYLLLLVAVYFLSFFLFHGKLKISLSRDKGFNFFITEGKKHTGRFKSKRFKWTVGIVAAIVLIAVAAIYVTSSKLFNASKYQQMLTVKESEFQDDIAELPLSQIPVVDRDSAMRLGSRKIGEVVELVSQFSVSDYYTQINFKQKPVRVSPLAYADILKWFVNRDEGIPYYIQIDMASQSTDLVELEEGMKYTPSEFFNRDLMRHVRFAYPFKMFDDESFEIDDNGHPYWVVSYYDYTIGFLGGRDITGVIVVDAVTGEMVDYPVSEVPQWIDCVFSADIVLEQANYWGAYQNGFWNSIFTQRNVVTTTKGYNYLAINDDVWVYTGITSVVDDASNIGFILINMRTKEAKLYSINGAEEFSAMRSAEGMVQEKAYTATFPILVNVADTPSYFISLKDNAGLVKAYSFVSVSNYQIVGVGDTLSDAQAEYVRLLKENGLIEVEEEPEPEVTETTVTGTIAQISEAVVGGNSTYYIQLTGNDTIFTAEISVSKLLPFLTVGDNVTLTYRADNTVKQIALPE